MDGAARQPPALLQAQRLARAQAHPRLPAPGHRALSTAAQVPETRGEELEGDDALETLRSCGRGHLLRDGFDRLRAADGLSHARALAFQALLALLPALIALVGFAVLVGSDTLSAVVRGVIEAVAPGAVGALLTDALRQGEQAGRSGGALAVLGGGVTALVSGTLAMAQLERSANRIYGVERDRPPKDRYLLALAMAVASGGLLALAMGVLLGGEAIRRALDLGGEPDVVWDVLRWPIGLAALAGALALLFEKVPRRRQPEVSWLLFGGSVAVVLWAVLLAALWLFVEAADGLGATYGPLAGTVGVLLWAAATALAALYGLAVAAQLEAVRAGDPRTRANAPPAAAQSTGR